MRALAAPSTGDGGLEPAVDSVRGLVESTVARLPSLALAAAVVAVGLVAVRLLSRGTRRALRRSRADAVVSGLAVRLLRVALVSAVVLVALSVAGVEVGPFLAGLGIAGLAVAFALQGILENFIAGVILIARKPFRAGDQIRTGEFEGTVEDIDLRVTRLVDYDGELILVPNVDVYTSALVNLTRRGRRRTVVCVGVDYRDDHDAAREVLRTAVAAVDGVLGEPAPEVLLTAFGESSVDFDVCYWTAPDIRSVRHTRDRVLSAAKHALEEAGMTIPWPIRTLVTDTPLRLEGAAREDRRAG